jgi:hypothetical protein
MIGAIVTSNKVDGEYLVIEKITDESGATRYLCVEAKDIDETGYSMKGFPVFIYPMEIELIKEGPISIIRDTIVIAAQQRAFGLIGEKPAKGEKPFTVKKGQA